MSIAGAPWHVVTPVEYIGYRNTRLRKVSIHLAMSTIRMQGYSSSQWTDSAPPSIGWGSHSLPQPAHAAHLIARRVLARQESPVARVCTPYKQRPTHKSHLQTFLGGGHDSRISEKEFRWFSPGNLGKVPLRHCVIPGQAESQRRCSGPQNASGYDACAPACSPTAAVPVRRTA